MDFGYAEEHHAIRTDYSNYQHLFTLLQTAEAYPDVAKHIDTR